MKAFNASIFTEQVQEELIKEANELLAQNPQYIQSLLEAENDQIIRDLELRRDAYISLIESQNQGLGLIHEAAGITATTGILMAIIALITYIITGIIAGSSTPTYTYTYRSTTTSSGKSSSSSSTDDWYANWKKENDKWWEDFNKRRKEREERYKKQEKEWNDWFNDFFGSSSSSGRSHSSSNDTSSGYGYSQSNSSSGSSSRGDYKKKTGTNSVANAVKDKEGKNVTSASDISFGKPVMGGGYDIPNPFWMSNTKNKEAYQKHNGITVDTAMQVASRTNVEVHSLIFPDLDLCCGNTSTIKDLVTLTDELNSTIISIWEDETGLSEKTKEQVNTTIKKIENVKDTVKHDFSNVKDSRDNTKTVNAAEFMRKEYDCFNFKRKSESAEHGAVALPGRDFDEPTNLIALRNGMQKCLNRANDIKYNPDNKEMVDAVQNVNKELVEFRKCLIDVAKDIRTACLEYRKCTMTLNTDLINANKAVVAAAKVNEAAGIWRDDFIPMYEAMMIGDPRYTDNPIAIEEAFGADTIEYSNRILFEDFYQDIDDVTARMAICISKNQTKAVNEEALIFSETGLSDYEKYQRLQAVNEAIGNKIKAAWYNSIAAIKEIFRKFIEKLNANFTTTKHYLDQYKKIILTSPFAANDTYNTQNLDLGIKRIYNAECPALNYQNVVNGDYETVGAFFNKVLYANLEKDNSLRVPGDDATTGDISNFFKAYFCMQDHEQAYTGPQFQKNIKNYYNFLYDIRKINDTIKKSLKNLEDTADKVLKQAGVNVQQQDAQQQTQQQEAVYSYLYQTWLTLNENGILVEAEINSGADAKAPSSIMKNVAQNQDDDAEKIKNADKSVADTKIKIYVDCCSSMLKAKMSAVEFIRNELMQIIRHHVQRYVGNQQQNNQQTQSQKKEQPQNNNQQQQQNNNQQQQQNTQKRDNIFDRASRAYNAFRGR